MMEYLFHYVLNVSSLILCKLPILFSIMKLKLGQKFCQFMYRFKIGIFEWLVLGCSSKFFPIYKETLGFLNVPPNGFLNFSQFRKKMENCFFFI